MRGSPILNRFWCFGENAYVEAQMAIGSVGS
jgi:hypothetical protein